MSGMFGSKAGTVQTQGTSAPWSGVQPFLLDAFGKAQNHFNTQSAPGSLMSQAQGAAGGILNGQPQFGAMPQITYNNLDPAQNPAFKASVEDALGQAGSAYAGQFGGAAGTNLGNSGYQESLARGLGAAATNAYSNQFNANQNNLLAQQALGTQQQGQGATQQLAGRQQQLSAAGIAPALANGPLAAYIASLSGVPGGQTTQDTPFFTNPAANALGLAGGIGALFGGGTGAAGAAGGAMSGLNNIGGAIRNLFGGASGGGQALTGMPTFDAAGNMTGFGNAAPGYGVTAPTGAEGYPQWGANYGAAGGEVFNPFPSSMAGSGGSLGALAAPAGLAEEMAALGIGSGGGGGAAAGAAAGGIGSMGFLGPAAFAGGMILNDLFGGHDGDEARHQAYLRAAGITADEFNMGMRSPADRANPMFKQQWDKQQRMRAGEYVGDPGGF